jgi:YVTN family beta-propeller protein
MKQITISLSALLLCNIFFIQCSTAQVKTNDNASLRLVVSIPLPNVSGRIDHLAYDSKHQFVYVAALGNNTVEVVDVKNKKVVHTIKGLEEPQGIRYIPERNAIFIANGGDGACTAFDADSYQQIFSIKLDGDADNVRYDSATHRIFVGYGSGCITILDATTFKQLADIKLPVHPESFQLDKKRIFVNVPNIQSVEIIDLEKKSIENTWKMQDATLNFPMSLDTTNHRIFIGFRHPAKLFVFDTENGKTVASLDTDTDTDDVFYDSSTKMVYMSCGGGFVNIIRQVSPDKYEFVSKIETISGARTSLFVPELHQLFVAAPTRSGNAAQLIVFESK